VSGPFWPVCPVATDGVWSVLAGMSCA